jgi:hypothetical protein
MPVRAEPSVGLDDAQLSCKFIDKLATEKPRCRQLAALLFSSSFNMFVHIV